MFKFLHVYQSNNFNRLAYIMMRMSTKLNFMLIMAAGISFLCLSILNAICLVHCLFHTEIQSRSDIVENLTTILIVILLIPFMDLYFEIERRVYGVVYLFYSLFHKLQHGVFPQFKNGLPLSMFVLFSRFPETLK